MIHRIIHLMFFGDWAFSDLNYRCHETWRKVLPDFDIKVWLPSTVPKEAMPQWVLDALARPGRAAGSNGGAFIKFWLLHKFGGIYFDNDIELLKPVELNHAYWCGWQRDGPEADVNMSACGCIPDHQFNRLIMERILQRRIDDHPLAFGPLLFTELLRDRGLAGNNVEQTVGDIKVYSREKWYPWFCDEQPDPSRITPETFGVHHWEASWKEPAP